ncbi:hypothetical protein HMPREF1141_0788 [Clostridium sp. MSTE9]|nr:hypothetical protein HMPREF1141_0788 [Clostridium sp. MSTE9]
MKKPYSHNKMRRASVLESAAHFVWRIVYVTCLAESIEK